MKRIFILAAVFALFTYSLFTQELDPTLVKKKQVMPETQNHSFLTQEYVGSSITVTGLLTVNKKTFTLKELLPESFFLPGRKGEATAGNP